MVVLFDLEWIEKDGIHLTQLSALRVNQGWDVPGDLDIIVNPGSVCLRDPAHIAFGSIAPDLFSNGVTEQDAILTFNEWLLPNDEVWVWAKSNLRLLGDLWIRWLPDIHLPHVYSMADKAREKALPGRYDAASPFTMLVRLNELPPFPEHRASNDVEAMRRLFKRIDLKRPAVTEIQPIVLPTQRECNRRMIDKTDYNYLYLKNSGVFHTRTCKACLNTNHSGNILGSVYYETAARNRRPCKICNPLPPSGFVSRYGKVALKPAEAGFQTEPSVTAPLVDSAPQNNELIKIKMLTGKVIQIKRKNVIGWCHHTLHKGAINRSILEEHDCLGKNCPYLERNSGSSFWLARKQEAELRAKQKQLKRANKEKDILHMKYLQYLADLWQSGLDQMESDMYIVRIEEENAFRYRVFYVSDNPFADGNRFPAFLDMVKASHPQHSVNLRHIRDVDGHFVTRDEYFRRFKKGRARACS